MIDLERALTDLAEHLDYPASEFSAEELRDRLAASRPTIRRRRGTRVLLAAAAVFVLVSLAVVAIAPARHAVADWLGIGAVEVRRTTHLPRPAPPTDRTVPGATDAARVADAEKRLAAARKKVKFTIATPHLASAGALTRVEVDMRFPGGLVALTYARFTLVEIATRPNQGALLGKFVGGDTAVEHVSVNGRAGLWIGSIHEIGYLDRSGAYRKDTVRRSGPVLLWERDGVTDRIEGLRSQADAQAVAAHLR